MRAQAGLITVLSLMLWPSAAEAFDGGTALAVSPLVLLAIALGLGFALYDRARRRIAATLSECAEARAELADAKALLPTAPVALYRRELDGVESFSTGGIEALQNAKITALSSLQSRLAATDAAAFSAALQDLHRSGKDFSLTLTFADGSAVLDAAGSRLSVEGQARADLVWFVDATQRSIALAENRINFRERERLREVIDALPIPAWRRVGADLSLADCNQAYAAALDAPREAVLASRREIAATVIPENGRALASRARGTGVAQSESRHLVIGGSRRLLEFTEAPLPSGDLVGYARDFTDLENIQAELARHIAAHAEVLENVAVAVAIYGPDTRLTFFNTAFSTLWRLEEDWLLTEPTLDEILERLRERRRIPEHADFRAFKRQQAGMFTSLISPQEELLHLPDDRTLRLVISPHPFGGLTFVYEDVTDKLALERSYNTMIEVQRETLDNLYEAVAVFGSDGRLKLWNPAYAQIWRLTPEDLTGEPHLTEIVEKSRSFFETDEPWEDMKPRIIARVTSYTASSMRLVRGDGSILDAATVPLPDGNVLLSYVDVTDSTRVENALRERNEALEMAGRLKSEFIANVSYELRTPLNAIIGFAEILTNQYFGELNPRQLDYSRGILDSSHRLLSLINDILDLATIEAGYMQLETETVDIHAMMSGVLALTRERARKQNLALEFHCPVGIGTLVGDERRLKQALFSLISNALKFTPPGGIITLSARRIGEEIALTVADTGVGVPSEDQVRIFEKFERGNTNARNSGPGLGLSLVKSFVELHGGSVELESHPGTGTTVTCRLSAAGPPPAVESPD